MVEIVVGILVFAGIVVTVLLRKNNFGGLKFAAGKDGVKVEVEAAKTSAAPAVQSGPVTTQIVQVGLNEETIKRELENLEKRLATRIDASQNLIQSGTQDGQAEINTLNQQLAGVQAKLDDTQKALEDRKNALAETEKALENEKLKNSVSEEQLNEARQKLEEGDASALEELLSQYMQERQSQDEPWAEVAYALGKLAEDRIDYQTAQEYYGRAVELAPYDALYLNQAGFLVNILGDYAKAIDYFEKALASDLKTFGPEHPDVAREWNNLGAAWNEKGEYEKAIDHHEKALKSILKTLGPDHPIVAITWNNLGSAWNNKGEYDKAIDYYEKALEFDLRTFGLEHPTVATRWNNLGGVWASKGEHDKSFAYYEKALASNLKTFGPEHPRVAVGWNNLGLVWISKGDYDKAVDYFEKALASDLKTYGFEHPTVANRWNNLGLAWKNKGDYDKAFGYYQKALQIVEKVGLPHRVQLLKDNIAGLKKRAGQ